MEDKVKILRDTFADFVYKNPDITEAYLYCHEDWREIIDSIVSGVSIANTNKLSENRYQSLNGSIINIIYDNNYNLELSGEGK